MIPSYIKPQKQIICSASNITGNEYWPYKFGENDNTWVGGSTPRYNSWRMTLRINAPQRHGYPYSTTAYQYNGLDINMGGYIARGTRGMIYRVSEVIRKSVSEVEIIAEDVYRTIDFTFNHSVTINPVNTSYVYFEVDETFSTNINSFEISSQINPSVIQFIPDYLEKIKFTQYPILCCNDDMTIGDIVAINDDGDFVKASSRKFNKVVGRVKMITGVPNEYVIKPIHDYVKIHTDIGKVGDIIYLDESGDEYTLQHTMKPMYLKILEAKPNVAVSSPVNDAKITANSKILLNDTEIEFIEESTLIDFVEKVNSLDIPHITADTVDLPFTIVSESNYEFGIMGIMNLPSVIKVNGQEVVISTTTAGQAKYGTAVAIGEDIVTDFQKVDLENIEISYSVSNDRISITNTVGGDIIIENISGGIFASDDSPSGTGLKETNIAPESDVLVSITHELGKEIMIRDIGNGNFNRDSGISGSDNGMLPRGIFYGGKVRSGDSYVIDHINDLEEIKPYIGDSVHVKDDGYSLWVEKKYTNSGWVTVATEDSARTDADTLSKIITHNDSGKIILGSVSANSRITNISIVVKEEFDDDTMEINIGDEDVNDRLFSDDHIDLLNKATYSNSPSHIYSNRTDLFVYINEHSSSKGELKIVISYQ